MENSQIIRHNIQQSKESISKNILKDNLLIFFTRIVEDLKRYKNPNFYGRIHNIFNLIYPYEDITKTKNIFNEIKNKDLVSKHGLKLNKKEIENIKFFISSLDENCKLKNIQSREKLQNILDNMIKEYCPHTSKIIEPYLIGKLISSVGGIKNLYKMPSSTIQLIGAEKAMFRHIAKGKPSPKYGLIFYSKSIQQSKTPGKTSRQLANKIAITIKQDYFKFLPNDEKPYDSG